MQKRKGNEGLPSTGFKRGGKHRSHVAGFKRFIGGANKSLIEDKLHQNARQLARRMRVGAETKPRPTLAMRADNAASPSKENA